MSDSTKVTEGRTAPAWPFAFVYVALMLLIMVLLEAFHVRPLNRIAMSFNPPAEAAGETLRQAIAEFAGRPPLSADFGTVASMFVALCVTFVLGPVLYITLRERIRRSNEQVKHRWAAVLGATMAGVWILLMAMTLPASFYASYRVFPMLKNDSELSQYASTMTEQVAEASFRYRQFAALPRARGGGGGTFLGKNGIVTLEELGIVSSGREGRFILVPQNNDTTVMLLFIGNRQFPSDTWSKSASGSTLIYESLITPASHRITAVR